MNSEWIVWAIVWLLVFLESIQLVVNIVNAAVTASHIRQIQAFEKKKRYLQQLLKERDHVLHLHASSTSVCLDKLSELGYYAEWEDHPGGGHSIVSFGSAANDNVVPLS